MKIVQCWDDGIVDDLRLIEILRKYNARASFNLNLGRHGAERKTTWKYQDRKEIWRLALGELTEVYEGFLVANHTLTHPHLPDIPIDTAIRDIREGRDRLEQLFGYPITGFAYPFGEYNKSIQKAVSETGHVYARTVTPVTDCFPTADPLAFHPNCRFNSPDFWSKVEHVRRCDGVFYFWGHTFELVTNDDWNDLESKIARLSALGSWIDIPDLFKSL